MGRPLESSSPDSSFLNESELFELVVRKGHGVKGLVDSGLAVVPPRYAYPPHERIDAKRVINAAPFLGEPIDLAQLEGENSGEVADAMCGAARRVGFFQVVNHGVPLDVLERAKRVAHAFFNLAPEKKTVYMKGKTPCPNVFYGTSFSPETEKALEWRDYFSMIYMNDEEAMQFWPPECRDAALAYIKATNRMIYTILNALVRGLGVEVDERTLNLYMESKKLQFNYYPVCPNPELTGGVGRHSDLEVLTVLLQDDIGGLYVKVEGDNWIEIPPLEGALVINVGDTLEILSNGSYKSSEHRVIASISKARVSVPIFVGPRPYTMIGPLAGLQEDEKAVYKHILFGEYMANYFLNGHKGKLALDFARLGPKT
eukprot:TRINITY_DN30_c0_g1_i1.p1 TRINITY_DN30_c0_g1~~TRINITY_DN30_c0_g1_i1.p1  ORF type:complete len:395 (-),score=38.17 TRINITY_DN30_c0_g1_i1:128-1240(-)